MRLRRSIVGSDVNELLKQTERPLDQLVRALHDRAERSIAAARALRHPLVLRRRDPARRRRSEPHGLVHDLPCHPAAAVRELLCRAYRRGAVFRSDRALVPRDARFDIVGLDERVTEQLSHGPVAGPGRPVAAVVSRLLFQHLKLLEQQTRTDTLESGADEETFEGELKGERRRHAGKLIARGRRDPIGVNGGVTEDPVRIAVALVGRPGVPTADRANRPRGAPFPRRR